MRVIAGELKGRRLVTPRGHVTRPTADRVRLALMDTLDDEAASLHVMLGAVQYALGPHPACPALADQDWQTASREADALIAGLGWTVAANAPARTLLIATLAALRRTESAPPGPSLRAYAEAMAALAAVEVASLDPGGHADEGARVVLAESAVVGMVLRERVLLALHRLAQEDASSRHFG